MGFYGNITNTSKTTFSFDLIYDTRTKMDENANTDGVFLGRYVLVDYDEEPIKAYYNPDKDRFYNTANFSLSSMITPREGVIYQDIHNAMSPVSFYKWDESNKRHVLCNSNTPYQQRFSDDVKNYGRGYDSTAWVKRYDTATDSYKYVMIAELNAVIPTLHMVVDSPTAVPTTPYFDRDTTNIDYYLHMQSDYGMQIKEQINKDYSDETVQRVPVFWEVDETGYQYPSKGTPTDVAADIYYNKAGFRHDIRTLMEEDGHNQDTINYSMAQSGRKYGADADLGVYKNGVTADDVYEWYIRLPSIGNSICRMWDKVYDNRDNGQYRALNKAQQRSDKDSNLVSYNKETLIGMMNTVQDLLGYTLRPVSEAPKTINGDTYIQSYNLTYDKVSGDPQTIHYDARNALYYDTNAEGVVNKYYYYAFAPVYEEATLPIDKTLTYYYKDGNVYRIANIETYNSKDADGESVEYQTYYTRTNAWELTELKTDYNDTVYGLLNEFNKLIGINAEDERNEGTIYGSINIIKDIVKNIGQLIPGKLLHTNNEGIIETTDTFYPSSTKDANRVLVGNPNKTNLKASWENRVRSIEVQTGSTSDNDWDTNTGTIDTNTNNDNEVSLKAGNKWIGLQIEPGAEQRVSIKHMKSTLSEHNFADDLYIDPNIDGTIQQDCKYTFPVIKTDNAGHVISYTTDDIYIPYNFRNITLNAQSTAETEMTSNSGTQSADNTNDTFTVGTGNQWITARIDDDQLTVAHALIDANAIKKWEFKSTSTDGWQNPSADGNKLTIPTFEIDNAGHVIRNSSVDFYIPNNFRNINIAADTNADVDSTSSEGLLEADSTTDTWTLASQNKWIDIKANVNDDTITIGHKYSPLKAWSFTPDASDALKTKNTDNSFTIPTFTTDNAGHIISSGSVTYYVPHNFKTVKIEKQSAAVVNVSPTTSDTNLVADNIIDTLSIATGNKWIQTTNDEATDKVIFSHIVQTIPTTTSTTDLNSKGTFDTEKYTYDEAGHIRSKDVITLTLPYNYKTVGVTQSDATNAIVTNESSIIAKDQIDEMTIAAGNKWIQLKADNLSDTITIAHSLQGTADSYGTNVKFNEFGGTVNLQGYTTDEAGHVIGYPTYTLTLPKGSYNNTASTNSSNVITGMSFNSETGTIQTTSENVGTLLLTGYSLGTESSVIAATDTLNAAIAKLQVQINNEISDRTSADQAINDALDTESQTRENNDTTLQSNIDKEIQDRTNADNNLENTITNLRIFKTVSINGTNLTAKNNNDILSISAGNDGIVIDTNESTKSFSINHKTIPANPSGTEGLYKIIVDGYGHVIKTSAVQLSDLTDLGLADTNYVDNAVNPTNLIDALYPLLVNKLNADGYIVAKEIEPEPEIPPAGDNTTGS